MGTRRHAIARQAGEVAVALPLFLAAPLLRRRHLRWGATDAEVAGAMPGDALIRDPSFAATRAITIGAPPEAVWPWIVQMGFGRGGWYSYDLLDNAGRPSAERVRPELQGLRVGDRIPMAARVTDATSFTVRVLDAPRAMLWEQPASTWAWSLSPAPGGRTRLVTRIRARRDWRSPGAALLSLILLEFGDFPMMRRMLLGLAARAGGSVGAHPPSP